MAERRLGKALLPLWLMTLMVITRASSEKTGRRLAETPPTLAGYTLLGYGWCDGDDLYRTMSYMTVTIADGDETLAVRAPTCAGICTNATSMNRCMGFQITGKGECLLFDRDWALSEKTAAETALSVTLAVTGIQETYAGMHLKRLNADPYLLQQSSSKGVACYRRTISCASVPSTCASLNRADCIYGKIANTCDTCLPRYTASGVTTPGNTACTLTNTNVPTLRLAFASAGFITEDNGDDRGVNQAYLSAAYAMKYAWENNYAFLPSPQTLVPSNERQNFNIEFYEYTENLTLATILSAGGTQQVSSTSVVPGLRAISGNSGGAYATELQLKEPSSKVHAVFGGLYSSKTSEKALADMSTHFQTPVLGYRFNEATLKSPYYIRTNRVALNAGTALAKLLQTIGYDTVTIIEQPKNPTVKAQIETYLGASATLNVVTASAATAGACAGTKACTENIVSNWQTVRTDDARVIVHEMGGDAFEFYLLMATDLLSEKTMYLQTGHACDYVNLMDTLAWAQAYYRAIDTANFSSCTACPNIIQYLPVNDAQKENWTYVAEYLFSSNNPYRAYQPSWCPQFPTVEDLIACPYCHGKDSVFASPECAPMLTKFEKMLTRSVCVEPDLSGDIVVREAYQNLLDCPGYDHATCTSNFTLSGMNVTSRLESMNFPATYLAPYKPGGAMWNKGWASTLARPMSFTGAWTDINLADKLGVSAWVNMFKYEFMDALATAVVGYNEFVRLGGDSDSNSDPSASPTSQRMGNDVAKGWKKFLLNADFKGMGGSVQYISEGKDVGERAITYKLYQMIPGATNGCWMSTTSGNSTVNGLNIRFVASTWNFKYVPQQTGFTGELKLADPGGSNEKGCVAFPSGYFSGKVAFIKRGACYFGTKMLNAQNAGALGMVMYNTGGNTPVFMSANDPSLTTSGVCIGADSAKIIWDAILAGSSVTITLNQPTSCFDAKFYGTYGLSVYFQTMSYNLKLDKLTAPNGNVVTCTGAANTPNRTCPDVLFNAGTNMLGTNTPPKQVADTCGDGYEYHLSVRLCVACQSGKYKLTSASEICRPCLAGQYASGIGNTECGQCDSGTFSGAFASSCTNCNAGYYSGGGSNICHACSAGYFSATAKSSQCSICTAGSYSPKNSSTCTLCIPGHFSDHGSAACSQCPGGRSANGTGNQACTMCDAGTFAVAGSGMCTTCGVGTYAKDAELTTCDMCDLGTSAGSTGSLGCTDCTPGKFAHQAGSSMCAACSVGEYTQDKRSTSCTQCSQGSAVNITGAANCTLCSVGWYQDVRGQTLCINCQAVITGSTSQRGAETSGMCECPKDYSYRPGLETCVACQVGMVCPQGKGIPTQTTGYSIEVVDAATRDYDSFECSMEKWCPAGPPETCEDKRYGRSCARISGDDCPVWAPFVLMSGIVLALYALYRMSEHSTYGKVSALMIMGGNLGIAINAMQSANVYLQFFQEVPLELDWMMAIAEIFMFKLNNVIPECHMGQGFTARLFVNVLPPVMIVGAYIGLFVLTKILSKVKVIRPMTIDNTVNAAGMLIQVMYIMQCKDAFSYFSSRDNPSSMETLQDYSDIIIWSDEHVSAGPLIIMIYLWLAYVVGTYCVFAWVVAVTKKRIADKSFRQKWRFILARWRPDCWYWGLFLLARNFLIAIIPITVRTDKVYRALVFAMLLAVHALAEVHWMPWMTGMNNWFEALISMVLMVMGIVGLTFTAEASKSAKVTAACFMAVFLGAVWVLLLFSFSFALHWNAPAQSKKRREGNHKAAEALIEKYCAIRDLLDGDDMQEKRRWGDFVRNSSSYDQALLQNMNKYLNEFEQNDVLRRRYSSWRSRTSEQSNGSGSGEALTKDEKPEQANKIVVDVDTVTMGKESPDDKLAISNGNGHDELATV